MAASLIYVLDDDLRVRRAVQRLLSASGYDVKSFANAEDFLAVHDAATAGCLVLDLLLPDSSGLEVLERLERDESPIRVVVISGHGDVPTTVRAMKRGAHDFLPKPFHEQDLLRAVEGALRRSAAALQARNGQRVLRERFETLTPREREVCLLVTNGYSNKQVAYELGTAEKTIKVHRGRVMTKLQVGSLAELVRMVDHVHVDDGDPAMTFEAAS